MARKTLALFRIPANEGRLSFPQENFQPPVDFVAVKLRAYSKTSLHVKPQYSVGSAARDQPP
jgi:hypothetical protein